MTTVIRHRTAPTPFGCRWCGEEGSRHGTRWVKSRHMHRWEQPTARQVLVRMRARREQHLTVKPVYHALTVWAATSNPEEGVPLCDGCGSETCAPWLRVQGRLDQIRWGITQPKSVQPVGWGGVEPW